MKKIYPDNKNFTTAFVCFYNASKNNYGASKISFNFFKEYKFKDKKLFQFCITSEKINIKNVKNVNLYSESPFFKLIKLPKLILSIFNYLKNKKKPILIIEGASWIFYSYITFWLIKKLIKNVKVIYHGHNVEYEVRKKNKLIKIITFFSEKFIYKNADISTVVSNRDKKLIYSLYKVKPDIFPNGYCLDEIKMEKIKLPKKFILFNGSYSYWPNKQAIDLIINYFHKKILNKNKDVYFIFTGHNFPSKYKSIRNVLALENMNDAKYKFILNQAKILFLPIPFSPGTKVKVIEALCEGKNIIGSKSSFLGIELRKKDNKFIYNNNLEAIKKINQYLKLKYKNTKNTKFYRDKYLYKNIIHNFLKKYLCL